MEWWGYNSIFTLPSIQKHSESEDDLCFTFPSSIFSVSMINETPFIGCIAKIKKAFKKENLQLSACQIQDVGWLPCTSWPGKCTMWNLFCIHHTLLGLVFNLGWEGLKILCSSRRGSRVKLLCCSSSTESGEMLLQGIRHKMRPFSLNAVGPISLIQLDEKWWRWQSSFFQVIH